MRWFACLLIPLALLATGCGSSVNDTSVEGPIDPALYKDAVDSNQQRLAGEDHPIEATGILSPLDVLAGGYDDLIAGPIESLWAYINHDSAGVSWRKMHDKTSADRRREGALELANYKEARSNKEALLYYAYRMADDPDYTVDAAAIRALNRSRAKGFTLVFVHGLNNDKPLVRTEAAKALSNIPDSAAVPLLIHCLQVDDSVDVRMACADALRNYKTIEVANALVGVLDDKDFSVAWQARQSLALMTGQDFRYDESAWLSYLSKGKVFGQTFMRALVFDQSLSLHPRHPEPVEADGDTLLHVRQAGICATDLEITRGYLGFRGILGHEFVADVVTSPDKNLLGQRVVGEINIVCGRCDLCLSGLYNHCRNRSVLGISRHNGAFADFLRMPAVNLHVLPKNIDDDTAVFVEPLAAAFQVLKQMQMEGKIEGSRGRKWVTVLGDGRLGLLVAQVLRNAGCPVRVIGKHPEKLALCEKWQIRSRPLADIIPRHDQDVVVDCTGSAAGFELAMQMVRPRGSIVLKSTVAAGKPINLAPLVIDEITVIGSRCGPFREAIRALAEKQIDVVSLIHRRMKIDQGVQAMELAASPGVMKVILTMNE